MKLDRNFEKDEYTKEISGAEFRESGALWFVNQILHLFGMALTWNPDTDEIKPAMCRFRGFDEKTIENGYIKLSNYLKSNINEIEEETRN